MGDALEQAQQELSDLLKERHESIRHLQAEVDAARMALHEERAAWVARLETADEKVRVASREAETMVGYRCGECYYEVRRPDTGPSILCAHWVDHENDVANCSSNRLDKVVS